MLTEYDDALRQTTAADACVCVCVLPKPLLLLLLLLMRQQLRQTCSLKLQDRPAVVEPAPLPDVTVLFACSIIPVVDLVARGLSEKKRGATSGEGGRRRGEQRLFAGER